MTIAFLARVNGGRWTDVEAEDCGHAAEIVAEDYSKQHCEFTGPFRVDVEGYGTFDVFRDVEPVYRAELLD